MPIAGRPGFAGYLSSVMAGLGVQAANGETRTELRRVAEIGRRDVEIDLFGNGCSLTSRVCSVSRVYSSVL
jgi:hypothetical protein